MYKVRYVSGTLPNNLNARVNNPIFNIYEKYLKQCIVLGSIILKIIQANDILYELDNIISLSF